MILGKLSPQIYKSVASTDALLIRFESDNYIIKLHYCVIQDLELIHPSEYKNAQIISATSKPTTRLRRIISNYQFRPGNPLAMPLYAMY